MKKSILLTALVVLFAVPAMAGIFDSKHNLGDNAGVGKSTTAKTGMTEVCIFCHAPHNPAQNQPLWNRNDGTATPISFYTNGTINMVQKGTATGFSTGSVSKFCMSCHDGSIGMWAGVFNKFGKGAPGAEDYLMTSSAAIGTGGNLSNDHPVNIVYNPAVAGGATEFNDTATAISKGVRFFTEGGTDQVECASCHDPHKTTNGKFLRTTNANSNLCLACHNK